MAGLPKSVLLHCALVEMSQKTRYSWLGLYIATIHGGSKFFKRFNLLTYAIKDTTATPEISRTLKVSTSNVRDL